MFTICGVEFKSREATCETCEPDERRDEYWA